MKKTPAPLKINHGTRTAIKADGTRVPVIDSPFTHLIQPNEEDIQNGVPGDHANCMLAIACRRLFDSELVWITRTLAYVELKGKGGKPELHRFVLESPGKNVVGKFDRGEEVAVQAIVFTSPKGAQKLDSKRSRWHKYGKTSREAKRIKGVTKTTKKTKDKNGYKKILALRDSAIGMFHFKTTQPASKSSDAAKLGRLAGA